MARFETSNSARRDFLKHSVATSAALLLPGRLVAGEEKVAKRHDAASGETHKLGTAIKLAKESLETLKKINDYEATFTKKEVVGKKLLQTEMSIKFREQPFSVYI